MTHHISQIMPAEPNWFAYFTNGEILPVIGWALCEAEEIQFIGALVPGGPGSWAGVLADEDGEFDRVEYHPGGVQ